MSGIVGIYYRDDRVVNRQDLASMVEAIAHRGSDGTGVWCENAVGLGHRLLWTTPESLLEQLPSGEGHLVITADGRLDNREDLISALGLNDRPAEKITDSQLILAAYQKWGDRCPERLLGDFAFAIWDNREQILFCARDPFGVVPFYYHLSDRLFTFASEIKALLRLPEVPHQLNEAKIAAYLTAILPDGDSTFYNGILRLPAGHCLTLSRTQLQIRTYWSLDPEREVRLKSNEEYAEAFRDIFTEAVQCRLRSAFPVGSHLSGGLDSSSITCTARKLLIEEGRQRQLHTFSARFQDGDPWDERFFQDTAIAGGNLQPHYIQAEDMSPLTDLDRVLWHQDEVFLPANLYFDWGMYDVAKQFGVRVVLDGFDGDSTVSHGYEYLRELAREGRWGRLAVETRAYGKRWNTPWKKVLWNWIWRYGIKPSLIQPLTPLKRIVKRSALPEKAQPTWTIPLNPNFVDRYDLISQFQAQSTNPPQTERERHYRLLTNDILQHCLECVNKTAAAFGIEPRFPFCDKRLLEFCLALPADQKLNLGWGRIVMRRAMEGILPPEIQWRVGKANFAPSLARGLQTYEKDRLEQTVLHHCETIAPYVDISALHQIYDRFASGNPREQDINTLHRTSVLITWLHTTKLTA
jgi:asparagine synthase (glutamine-hydrolysing)